MLKQQQELRQRRGPQRLHVWGGPAGLPACLQELVLKQRQGSSSAGDPGPHGRWHSRAHRPLHHRGKPSWKEGVTGQVWGQNWRQEGGRWTQPSSHACLYRRERKHLAQGLPWRTTDYTRDLSSFNYYKLLKRSNSLWQSQSLHGVWSVGEVGLTTFLWWNQNLLLWPQAQKQNQRGHAEKPPKRPPHTAAATQEKMQQTVAYGCPLTKTCESSEKLDFKFKKVFPSCWISRFCLFYRPDRKMCSLRWVFVYKKYYIIYKNVFRTMPLHSMFGAILKRLPTRHRTL